MSKIVDSFLYWRHKQPSDNEWHPILGARKTSDRFMPSWLKALDESAIAVDAAPFVFTSGVVAYLRQLPQIGFTAPASLFKNRATLRALATSSNLAVLTITAAQLAGIEYRYYIPRWASPLERLRDDEEARGHIQTGCLVGALSWMTRQTLRLGPVFTRHSLLDIVAGGALADVLLREYHRAHGR